MWRLIKALLFLVIIAGLGLVAYAYIGPLFFPADFAAPSEEVTYPVTLETN
jgi:predicted small lipoprotein YifL